MTERKARAKGPGRGRTSYDLTQVLTKAAEGMAEYGRQLRKLLASGSDIVMLPRAEYEALLERLADLEDRRDMQAAVANAATREYLPMAVADRLRAGEHPLRVWREHRGLTLTALAEKSGVGRSYIADIEAGKKPGSVRALKALADALRVDLGDLAPAAPRRRRQAGRSPRR
jgi:DNA-binding XRE family transcriptional regulator